MTPEKHATTNATLNPAPGTEDTVIPLPITRHSYSDGTPCVVSFWRPSEAELAALNAGKPVQLTCQGETHVPLWVGVDGVDE